MKNLKSEALLWAQLGGFVVIWVIILYVTGTGLVINWDAVKRIPDAVTVYIVAAFVFTKWLWRWKPLRGWLVPFPDVQGTWRGELRSTWKAASGEAATPIPVVMVIRQTFSSISCSMFTGESESSSTAAQISADEEHGAIYLNYNYTNRPRATVRDRSAMHDGAARLRVISSPKFRLAGEFWTSRCTAGEIDVFFQSRELADSFSPQSREPVT